MEQMAFTGANADRCPKQVGNCFKTNVSGRCDGAISDCIAENCRAPGSCSDEMSNRNLFGGCLQAVNQVMPYQCSTMIAGRAASKAQEVKAAIATQQQQAEIQKVQAESQAASERARAEQAAAEAQVRAQQEQAASSERIRQMELQAESQKQIQAAQLAQQAEEARIAREKQEAAEKRANKPGVKYASVVGAARQEISSARTYANNLFSMLGIVKTTETQASGNAMFFPPQIIDADPIRISGADAKTKSFLNSSKYAKSVSFKCTRNVRESFARTELANIVSALAKARDSLGSQIAAIETANADDENMGVIGDDKITTLYQIQNKITESLNTAESSMGQLTTSCETRCEGMNMMASTSYQPVQFDAKGNIVESDSSSGSYSCPEIENSGGFDMMAMMSGTANADSMLGGTARKAMEITSRVTRAAVEIDRSLDATEIAIGSGNFADADETELTQINACLQFTITDPNKYVDCAKQVIGQQFAYLSQHPKDASLQENLLQSFVSILDTLNGNAYKNVSQCDILSKAKKEGEDNAPRYSYEGERTHDIDARPLDENKAQQQLNAYGGIAKNPCCNWDYPANKHNIGVSMQQELHSARQCSQTLSSRLDKVKWFIEREDKDKKDSLAGQSGSGGGSWGIIRITSFSDTMIYGQNNYGSISDTFQGFVNKYCPNATYVTPEKNGNTVVGIKVSIKNTSQQTVINDSTVNNICQQSRNNR
jgi:hypothetical protein